MELNRLEREAPFYSQLGMPFPDFYGADVQPGWVGYCAQVTAFPLKTLGEHPGKNTRPGCSLYGLPRLTDSQILPSFSERFPFLNPCRLVKYEL